MKWRRRIHPRVEGTPIGAPPAAAERNVATLVSRLRGVLGSGIIVGGRHGYRLAGEPEIGVDLKAHMGHKVTITGTPMKSKQKVKAGQPEEGEHLRVSNLSMVSTSCP